jgi:hypothetical protein
VVLVPFSTSPPFRPRNVFSSKGATADRLRPDCDFTFSLRVRSELSLSLVTAAEGVLPTKRLGLTNRSISSSSPAGSSMGPIPPRLFSAIASSKCVLCSVQSGGSTQVRCTLCRRFERGVCMRTSRCCGICRLSKTNRHRIVVSESICALILAFDCTQEGNSV